MLDMPPSVQTDLVTQLRHASENETSTEQRRLTLYNLALCNLSGFGAERVDADEGLALLHEAAQLGSARALSIVFRLHAALEKKVPSALWQIKHPVVELEKSLQDVGNAVYFTRRLRGMERVYQEVRE